MPILADCHMHSNHSSDSTAEMEAMVSSAIEKGLTNICFTEHQDHGYPFNKEFPEGSWMLNVDSYLYDLLSMREQFMGKISIGFGIEIGMQEKVLKENFITSNSQDFDFVIASIHVVNGFDTYDHKYFDNRPVKEAMTEYFETECKNIKLFKNFDVLGHMDYIVRTVPGGESVYNYKDYADYIDDMLSFIAESGRGIEINTCALTKGFKNPNPCLDIIKRYKELGGEIITFGSDAHKPSDIAGSFDVAAMMALDAGFKYYCTFEHRQPDFHRI